LEITVNTHGNNCVFKFFSSEASDHTLIIIGFDLQQLWTISDRRSPAICPPNMSFFQVLADCICWPFQDKNISSSSSKKPLLERPDLVKLYDPTSILSLSPDIITGFLILLGRSGDAVVPTNPSGTSNGRQTSRRRGKRDRYHPSPVLMAELDDSSLSLAFLAITDGNVVDTCFGVHIHDAHYKETPAYRLAKDAKDEISEAAEANEDMRRVAVLAYGQAFQVALECRRELEGLDLISACFRQGRIQRNARLDLAEALTPLADCIQEAKTL
jgi:hypothetical protein